MNERLAAILSLVLPCSVPVAVLAAYGGGAPWAFRIGAWVSLAALVLDFRAGGQTRDHAPPAERSAFRGMTWLAVPLQTALLIAALLSVRRADLAGVYATAVGAGMIGGMFG